MSVAGQQRGEMGYSLSSNLSLYIQELVCALYHLCCISSGLEDSAAVCGVSAI